MDLKFHNTLSGKDETFQPIEPGKVKMYVCGITPYDVCHLGHARCYVTFDFIRRSLKRLGFNVRYVQNFTDIDDKIISRSLEKGESPTSLAEKYIQDYFDKMDQLNILRADVYPRVTQHIPQIIAFIEQLVQKEKAYSLDGDVYYSVRGFKSYGRLSKRSIDDLRSGARVEVDERKKDPLDFALWKAAKPGEPSWESPWGKGRPGWHIECSVMSIENLKGNTFDIHGGGLDLVFPHHENEIAQAEGATGETFSRCWIHNGFVTVNKQKMSKSLGNFFTLHDIFQKYEPRVVRFLLMSQHYRTPLEFSDDLLEKAKMALKHIDETYSRLLAVLESTKSSSQNSPLFDEGSLNFEKEFSSALKDDFNSPKALAALHGLLNGLVRNVEREALFSKETLGKGLEMFRSGFEDVLGVKLVSLKQTPDKEIDNLVKQRSIARKEKNWSEADRIREELTKRKVIVEDTPQGPRWWKK